MQKDELGNGDTIQKKKQRQIYQSALTRRCDGCGRRVRTFTMARMYFCKKCRKATKTA